MESIAIKTSGKESILIVDDNPQNLQVLGRLLQEKNYDIEFATSGDMVFNWLQVQLFDLILLDINMPGMSGFEVCEKIRASNDFKKIPIIFLSADVDRESLFKGFELGAQDYVTKPFDSRELLVRVRTQIMLKKSLEQIEQTNRELEKIVAERTAQLKKANDDLEKINSKLMEIDTIKSDFLNLISHEIRTPLNGIIGITQLLKEPLLLSNFSTHFKALDSSVKRLENFAINALMITEIKTYPDCLSKESIDIEKCIDNAINSLNSQLESKHARIKINYKAYPSVVQGDSDLLAKCFYNLIENAIIYSPPGESIEIETQSDLHSLIVTIADNGGGFPDKILNSKIEIFSTGGEYREKALGIGLPLAKMIVEIHGGELVLSNRPLGGALVELKFPIA